MVTVVRLAGRVAADSTPPLRLRVLVEMVEHPASSTHEVRVRLNAGANRILLRVERVDRPVLLT
jgi:hypothetical protein